MQEHRKAHKFGGRAQRLKRVDLYGKNVILREKLNLRRPRSAPLASSVSISLYVYMQSLYICVYIRKRQFCQVEAMKMRDSDRKMSLHAFCDICLYASHLGLHVIILACIG